MSQATSITVAKGDGIGPEIMDATLRILEAAGAELDIEEISIGEQEYLKGNSAGISQDAFESILRTKVFLKAPITTPQGGGYKSLNVTTRKALGLYANVRPCVSYHPFVRTKHPEMDVVVVRENEEDLYAGIEHQQTVDVTQCLKLITRQGTERVVRYAFEYAKANNRKKVTCFTKDNIMKITDGLFHKIFEEIAKEYSDIENEHWIVDIGAAKLADTPENFDVVVMPNLYGDILSDVSAQIAGSVGLAGSANIGPEHAMFEAIHGSAPRRAGQNLANPSGLFLGSVLMLVHIGQVEAAERAHNAWLKTIEDGIHTYDIFKDDVSKEKVGTKEFAEAVSERVGDKPETLSPVVYNKEKADIETNPPYERPVVVRELVGVDVFCEFRGATEELAALLEKCNGESLKLRMISSRGMSVWPGGFEQTLLCDHWRCRFLIEDPANGGPLPHAEVVALLDRVTKSGLEFIKTEGLYYFDGEPAFQLGQGQK
jgi:isocitrate dehydrogenase